jgi:hypothetical protein
MAAQPNSPNLVARLGPNSPDRASTSLPQAAPGRRSSQCNLLQAAAAPPVLRRRSRPRLPGAQSAAQPRQAPSPPSLSPPSLPGAQSAVAPRRPVRRRSQAPSPPLSRARPLLGRASRARPLLSRARPPLSRQQLQAALQAAPAVCRPLQRVRDSPASPALLHW